MNTELFDYIRHLSKQDTKTLSQKVLKAAEELGELSRIALPYENAFATNHRFTTREKILEEAVDLTLCALSVAYDQNFTHAEIEEMMQRKTRKWQGLQAAEQNLKYPIPFEIHVTVVYDNAPSWYLVGGKDSVAYFKEVCTRVGVKPVLLDLHTNNNSVIKDLMTSSTHFGTNASAYEEAMRIGNLLHEYLYDVVRIKIETVPWHPASPKQTNMLYMPENCYFEAHIPVIIKPNFVDELKNHFKKGDIHFSNNAFKKHDDGTITLMLTYRCADCKMEEFETAVERIQQILNNINVPTQKIHKEFSIYDTNVHHDADWLLTQLNI